MCFSPTWFTSKCLKFYIHIYKIGMRWKWKPKLKHWNCLGAENYGLKNNAFEIVLCGVIWCHSVMAIAETSTAIAVTEATLMVLVMSFDFGIMAEELNEVEFTVRTKCTEHTYTLWAEHIFQFTTKAHYIFGILECFEQNIVIILYYHGKFPTSVFIIYAMTVWVCVWMCVCYVK